MGPDGKPLFPVIWEERMAQSLEELRDELVGRRDAALRVLRGEVGRRVG